MIMEKTKSPWTALDPNDEKTWPNDGDVCWVMNKRNRANDCSVWIFNCKLREFQDYREAAAYRMSNISRWALASPPDFEGEV